MHVVSPTVTLVCNHVDHSLSAQADSDGPHIQLNFPSPLRSPQPFRAEPLQDVELMSIFPMFAELSFDQLLDMAQAYSGNSPVEEMERRYVSLLHHQSIFGLDLERVQLDVDSLVKNNVSLADLLAQRFESNRTTTLQMGICDSSGTPIPLFDSLSSDGLPIFGAESIQPLFDPNLHSSSSAVTTACLVSRDHRANKVLVLPASLVETISAKDGITVHISDAFAIPKNIALDGRLIVNYSSPIGSSVNHPEHKEHLERLYGPIGHVHLADICATILDAIALSPDGSIMLGTADVDTGFNRIAVHPPHVPLLAFNFIWDGIVYTAFPLLSQLGSQTSNYGFGCTSQVLAHLLAAFIRKELLTLFNQDISTRLSLIYVDDLIYAIPTAIAARVHAYAKHLMERMYGHNACSVAKHQIGHTRTILGWTFDLSSMSFTITPKQMLKLLALLFHDVPQLVANTVVSRRYLERLSSYMIRTANAIPSLLSFSRGAADNLKSWRRAGSPDQYRVSHRLYRDILFWKTFLRKAFSNPQLLVCSIFTPPYWHCASTSP